MSSSLEVHEVSQLSPPQTSHDTDRKLSRSPHPYHRRSASISQDDVLDGAGQCPRDDFSESSTERGTEADDERGPILKGLPAPPLRARKGLRGSKSPIDMTPAISPLPTPQEVEDCRPSYFGGSKTSHIKTTNQIEKVVADTQLYTKYIARRRAEIVRRCTESVLLTIVGLIACKNTLHTLQRWKAEMFTMVTTVALLYATYPIRLSLRAFRQGSRSRSAIKYGFHIPSRFDPGPLLYPVFVPFFIAASLIDVDENVVIVNLALGVASVPRRAIPLNSWSASSQIHWILAVLPMARTRNLLRASPALNAIRMEDYKVGSLGSEALALLFPLHQTVMSTIRYLTATSLDECEIQLLSVGLINLLLFASSPQTQILKGAVWLGGISLFVFCRKPLSWEVSLARIPTWKFMRNKPPRSGIMRRVEGIISSLLPRNRQQKLVQLDSDDEDYEYLRSARRHSKFVTNLRETKTGNSLSDVDSSLRLHKNTRVMEDPPITNSNGLVRSETSPPSTSVQSYPSRGHRRLTNVQRSGLLSLTLTQARGLKWLIAMYVYVVVILILMLGIRTYVEKQALYMHEPFGWAIGYLFGNISAFRFWVVSNNWEWWICLPRRISHTDLLTSTGWLERFRQIEAGPANVRLWISAYCLLVLTLGIGVVLRLKSVVEVDTRRKVFHGIMVAMMLPTIPIDPCFISLALMVILAAFLLLDLFRASQLPPISKPLTTFLAPYVDGRDYRGPVIVSPIFLLIGCAIPLWLALAGAHRSGQDPWTGWEIQGRDLSMISGVVCVGMGDAAASLIGRRYGKTKWFWGGGKSLEGSLAFAVAVAFGLMASYIWLRVGGWVAWDLSDLPKACVKASIAASGASVLESVLTAANDNVVVPIGLWLLVRGLQI